MNEFYEKMDRYAEHHGAQGWVTFRVKTGPMRDEQGFNVHTTPSDKYLVAPSGYAVVRRDDGRWERLRKSGEVYGGDLGCLGSLPELRGGCPVMALLNLSKGQAEQVVLEMGYDASCVAHGALRVSCLMGKAAAFACAAEFLEG